ncbi:MAG: cyclic nucleotide-binding domain-containing protein [Deltaproteobacteria bacterium]|nr:cyclic nucleotide-binding domain-containing protein [Deltaproteobacteria bacterium]
MSDREEQVVEELVHQEALVDQYVEENNTEAAVRLLFDIIVDHAKARDFAKAKTLWEKLSEVDPMALTEITKSGEIIEEEQRGAIDQNHRDVWSELYRTLTTEETNTLYYAMQEQEYDPDQIILKQGDRDTHLYFIDSGQVKMISSQEGMEILVNTLGPGSIVGVDTFFADTVCTTSLVTLSGVILHIVDKNVLATWHEECPSLEPKLHQHCLKLKTVDHLLKEKGLNRRSHKRVGISGKGIFQVLDVAGDPVGKAFKGNLSDISTGGMSFFLKISKKETGSLLLGRGLHIRFTLPQGASQQEIDINGTVVAVRSHPFEDYSVHIKFDRMLSERIVAEIERLATPDQW